MSIDLDLDNKCIKIDGVFYSLVQVLKGNIGGYKIENNDVAIDMEKESSHVSVKSGDRTFHFPKHSMFDDARFKDSRPKENNSVVFSFPEKSFSDIKNISGLLGFLFTKEDGKYEFVKNDNSKLEIPDWVKDFSVIRTSPQPQSEVSNGYGFEIVAFKDKRGGHIYRRLNPNDIYFTCMENMGHAPYEEKDFPENNWWIYSVKRKSDNTIWTIGDEVEKGKIIRFEYRHNTIKQHKILYALCEKNNERTYEFISGLKKAPVDDGGIHFWNHIKMVDENTFVPVDDVKKDYEVLQFNIGTEIYNNVPIFGFQGKAEIRVVKRLSDREIFSVGDNVCVDSNFDWKIESFTISRPNRISVGERLGAPIELNRINHWSNKKPSPSKEQVEEKKIITPDPNFMHDLDDKWGEFTPYENEKRMWYGEKLYNELCEKYKSQPKSEPTLTDKTISYQELEQQINLVLENKNFLGNEKFGAEFMAAKLRLAFKPKS